MTGNKLLLQERDRKLLAELGVMRIIDCEQTKVIGGFSSTRRANRRLLKLTRAGLLNRFFVGTVASGRKAVYVLSKKGASLVASPQRLVSRRFGQTVVGDLFVDHQMHINEVFAAVKFLPLPDGVEFMCWRSFAKPVSRSSLLIPDGYFQLHTAAGIRAHFLEVDLGTETRAVWEKKISTYLQFASSGEFQRAFEPPQFRVLVLTTSEKRLANIRAVILKHTDKIFYLTTFECIKSSGLWSPLWLRPKGEQRQSLI